jgi:glucans biosynthesis protein
VLFVIDLVGPSVEDARDMPVAHVTNSAGKISHVVVQRNDEISGVRVTFELTPGEAGLVELRFLLKAGEKPISETWLYRWTKP